ncbi:hypothetical protein [Planctobacterium marinum]|uniref:hypothetical protein n=1 Tax=Planctobacterium marinum TaxID=1631968 RepID=UPI001E3CC758|nr:hypothetical protein [Planctobacterium marinum]MCC2605070.1 hypothetical protein [Planctobacterium marinum]
MKKDKLLHHSNSAYCATNESRIGGRFSIYNIVNGSLTAWYRNRVFWCIEITFMLFVLATSSAQAGHGTYLNFQVVNQTENALKFKMRNHRSSGGSFIHSHGSGDYSFCIEGNSSKYHQLHVYADTFDSPGDVHFYPENSGNSGGVEFVVTCSNSGTYNPDITDKTGNTVEPCAGCTNPVYHEACNSGISAAPGAQFWFLVYNGEDFKSDNNKFWASIDGKVINDGSPALRLHNKKSEADNDHYLVLTYSGNSNNESASCD